MRNLTPLLPLLVACATGAPLVEPAPVTASEQAYADAQRAIAQRADTVRVGKADPPAAMKELGPLEAVDRAGCGPNGRRGTYEEAYRNLKFAAAEAGAD